MLKPIKTEEQNNIALARIYELIQKDVQVGSPDGDELEVLSILVHEFESKNYKIPKPTPLDAIRFRLDQLGLSEADLSKILGSRSRKSEILSGRRKLSLDMIRKLHGNLKIPAAILIQPY
jgi:HTH-type transcriptional regulator / antitoxin HigA